MNGIRYEAKHFFQKIAIKLKVKLYSNEALQIIKTNCEKTLQMELSGQGRRHVTEILEIVSGELGGRNGSE